MERITRAVKIHQKWNLGMNAGGKHREGNARLKSNIRTWSLVAGALIILAACVFSYILTKPAEADASILHLPVATQTV